MLDFVQTFADHDKGFALFAADNKDETILGTSWPSGWHSGILSYKTSAEIFSPSSHYRGDERKSSGKSDLN